LEECTASVFRIKEQAKQARGKQQGKSTMYEKFDLDAGLGMNPDRTNRCMDRSKYMRPRKKTVSYKCGEMGEGGENSAISD
jgi:hypothetical protein